MLRLFDVGHRAEPRFVEELKAIGVEVHEYESYLGQDGAVYHTAKPPNQWHVGVWGGHFGGSMDGVAVGVPGGGNQWHVLEFKTWREETKSSQVGFRKLQKLGVKEAKFQHYCQMQIYMGMTGLLRALYLAECKNTSELYWERIKFDETVFAGLLDKAEAIIFGRAVPVKLSDDPEYFECKWCDFRQICHSASPPQKNCRTCTEVKANRDGTWSCTIMAHSDMNGHLTDARQRLGCDEYSQNKGFEQ